MLEPIVHFFRQALYHNCWWKVAYLAILAQMVWKDCEVLVLFAHCFDKICQAIKHGVSSIAWILILWEGNLQCCPQHKRALVVIQSFF